MKFSEKEIEIAQKLKELGFEWTPAPGDYVYDIEGLIEKKSPFQERVYFILDIKHFLRRAGSVEGITKAMCYLPLWEDCRVILKSLSVPWQKIYEKLIEKNAFINEIERSVLYEIILKELTNQVKGNK